MFDAAGEADERAFAARCEDDRHHFRFIVSPEDATQLADLRAFARELMSQAEADLGTRLDWIAVDHWNTAHPHLHVLVRGVDGDGADLVIDRDYISRGLRGRAEALVTLELGPRRAREVVVGLESECVAERWTRLDQQIESRSTDGVLDLRPGPGALDAELRQVLMGRMATLERLGLATRERGGVWAIAADLRRRLHGLGERTEIVATLHRVVGAERPLAELEPHGEQGVRPILGRLADRGLHDELNGAAYVIVDAVDGRAHHVRLPDLWAAGDTPVGGLVEVRRSAHGVQLLHRSDLSLEAQVQAGGATWLDRQLLAREPAALAEGGFGRDVRLALERRVDHLAKQNLAMRGPGGRFTLSRGLLQQLRAGELAAVGARLARETGLRFEPARADREVRGRYRRRLDLASGRFAMIEDGLGFRLVPWARPLDRALGREVSGTVVPGGVNWDLGRSLGAGR